MDKRIVKINSKQIRRAVALGMIEELNAKEVSRAQIAEESGLSYRSLQNWVRDIHAPSVKNLRDLEKVHKRHCSK